MTHIVSAIPSQWSFPFAAHKTAISWQLEWKRRQGVVVVEASAVKGGDGSGGDSIWASSSLCWVSVDIDSRHTCRPDS